MPERAEVNRGVKVLLQAGGLRSRLRLLTDTTSKCLAPIVDCPLPDDWLAHFAFAEAGLRDNRINTHVLPRFDSRKCGWMCGRYHLGTCAPEVLEQASAGVARIQPMEVIP